MNDINKDDLMEIESLVFKRLTKHLQDNPEVQNIDLMNLANFVGTVYLNGLKQNAKERV